MRLPGQPCHCAGKTGVCLEVAAVCATTGGMHRQTIRHGLKILALTLALLAPRALAADLLKAAADYFQWTPERPANELEFKRAYARFASSAGLTREQAVRVYAFETGGNGSHASQSGFHGSHAISTAIGYNQLLTTNTVELLAEQGEGFIKVLTARAATLSGPARLTMERKVAVLKKMVALARSVPDDWSQHEKIGDTPQGWALHAMVLDID